MEMMLARTSPPKVRVGGTVRKLVVEDEQHLQLRVSLNVLIYFVLYHIFFIVSVLIIPNVQMFYCLHGLLYPPSVVPINLFQ